MLCEKCGKKNKADAVKCSACGAPMPGKSGCGGFGDILSYEKTTTPTSVAPMPSGADSAEIAKLSKHIRVLEKNNKKLGTFSLISVVLSVIAVGISVFVLMSSFGKEDMPGKNYDSGYESKADVDDIIDEGITEDDSLPVEKIAETAAKSEKDYGLNPGSAQAD